MRSLLVLAAALFFTSCIPLDAQSDVPQLEGGYTIAGVGPKGAYGGTVEIHQKDRAVLIRWITESGESLQGFGVISGEYVAAGYALNPHIGAAVLYHVEEKQLVGHWADPGGAVWTETLTKGKPGAQAN